MLGSSSSVLFQLLIVAGLNPFLQSLNLSDVKLRKICLDLVAGLSVPNFGAKLLRRGR